MKFKAKRDVKMTIFSIMISLFALGAFTVPMIFSGAFDPVPIEIGLIVTGSLIWIFFDMVYTLKDDDLIVRAGPFFSKINYKDISHINITSDMWTGYRMMASSQGIEIHYRTGLLGSVKITPENQKLFLQELKRRNENIDIRL